ncbi:response regulator [Bacillus sp. J33]|uniref:response regulator n=1 Tax=Bacillus sp. J33 TaxID=935836 RepID=UPI000479EBED|nr:response regulator [Bacillus sp. J33]
MIRTILVDDEELSLLTLEKKLQDFPEVEVFRRYTSHERLLSDLKNKPIDAAFLDIEMGEINGLQLAREILSIHPYTQIVFVSGHANYAVNAFELDSIDYLLKPVTAKRLEKTINRLKSNLKTSKSKTQADSNEPRIKICCFSKLQIFFDGKPIRFKTAKSKELFAFLLINMGSYIHRDIIIEKIWPGHDYKNAKTYLHTSLSYLRKLLSEWGCPEAISFLNQSYCLLLDSIYFDAKEFNRLAKLALSGNQPDYKALDQAIELYKGAFLEEDGYEWGYEYAESYEQTLTLLLSEAIKELKRKDPNKAISLLKIYKKIEPYSEYAVLNLMEIYAELGMQTDAIRTYQQYAELLNDELALDPASKIQDLYAKLIY